MKFVVILVLMLHTAIATAQSQSGKITGYIPYENGQNQVLIFQIQGNVSGGCNTTARFSIDSTSPKFKGTQAAVIAAYHSQADVQVLYAQTCNSWINSWDVRAVCIGSVPC
jgi:hypothetical protein